MSKPLEIRIDPTTGSVRHIYDPAAIKLCAGLGTPQIRRASHVEPDSVGRWWADLSPVGGPKLGPYPPDARDQALQDEHAWLVAHGVPVPEANEEKIDAAANGEMVRDPEAGNA